MAAERHDEMAEYPRRLRKQLANHSLEEPISEKICERIVDVRVPPIVEQVIEVSQISSRSRILGSTAGQILDVPVLEMAQQLVELPKAVSQDRIQQLTVEQIVDAPVSQIFQDFKVFSQDKIQQRSVEETVEIPQLEAVEKIDETLEIQMVQGQTCSLFHQSSSVDLEPDTSRRIQGDGDRLAHSSNLEV